jgi:hypothetical protein
MKKSVQAVSASGRIECHEGAAAPSTTCSDNEYRRALGAFGWWAALGTSILTAMSFTIAVLTPPLSGPLCQAGCIAYPYQNIAERFPRDYWWMFPAIPATLFYLALMVALHHRAKRSRRPLASFALLLSAIAAAVLVGDYFVQLAVIQPSVLARETDGVAMLSQYNAHGLFIALEELGYLLMSISLACMAFTVPAASRLESSVRRLFWGAAVINLAAFVGILVIYGHAREYLFEIAVITVDWSVLIAGSLCLVPVFGRDKRAAAAA